MSVKILKLIETPGRVKSREDVLIVELERFYNREPSYSQIFLGTVMKRTDADDDSKITCKSDTSKQQLNEFISKHEGLPSLRLHEWFITNYSKKHDTHYFVHVGEAKYRHIFVHREYKAQLDSYSKKLFDPFCRRSRILFVDPFGNQIKTTVAQLNYFQWAIENSIIDYIKDNLEAISGDMIGNQPDKKSVAKSKAVSTPVDSSEQKTTDMLNEVKTDNEVEDVSQSKTTAKKTRKRKPRSELSISASKLVTKHKVTVTVSFN